MIILFDTNVLLDVLLRREPHATAAVQLFAAVERGTLAGLIAASAVPTLYYLAAKAVGARQARTELRNLLKLFDVAPVTRVVLEDALSLPFPDYEDAILHETARHVGATGIVTRNQKDFKRAKLRVYTPDELVQIMQAGSSAQSGEDLR